MEMPKFNIKSDVTEDQMKKIEAANAVAKFFKPGNYDLKIVSAALHKMSESDPTWAVFAVELGGLDDRKIKTFVLVPTGSVRYNKPGLKNPMIMAQMLRQFLRSIGEDSSMDTLGKTVKSLFSDPVALVGKTLNVDIGHRGHYVDRIGDNQYKIFEKDGREFKPEGQESAVYPDRDSAIADAATYNVAVKGFAEVLKYNPKETEDEVSDPWSN